jgi:hypothetical protein
MTSAAASDRGLRHNQGWSMKLLPLLLATFAATSTYAGEWGELKSPTPSNLTIDLANPGRKAVLVWPLRILPGETLLRIESSGVTPGISTHRIYTFVGIAADSLRIDASGSTKGPGQASPKPDPGLTQTLLIERASDGLFYFATSDIAESGFFKISRVSTTSPAYAVELVRSPP